MATIESDGSITITNRPTKKEELPLLQQGNTLGVVEEQPFTHDTPVSLEKHKESYEASAWSAALREENAVVSGYNHLSQALTGVSEVADPNFTNEVKNELQKDGSLMEGINPAYFTYINEAINEGDFYARTKEAYSLSMDYNALANLPWYKDLAYRMGAVVTELPMYVAGGMLFRGAQATTKAVNTTKKLFGMSDKGAQYLTAFLGGAVTEGALEVYKGSNSLDEERGVMTAIMTSVLGGAGASAGVWLASKYGRESMEEAQASFGRTINDMAENTTDELGAPISDIQRNLNSKNWLQKMMRKAQFDQYSYFESSPSASMRAFGEQALFDGSFKGERAFSASEVADYVASNIRGTYFYEVDALGSQWHIARGGNGATYRYNIKAQQEFHDTLGRAYYGVLDLTTLPQNQRELIEKGLEGLNRTTESAHDVLSAVGHPMFKGDVPAIPKGGNYLPRQYDAHRLLGLVDGVNVTKKDIVDLLQASYRSGLERLGVKVDEKRLMDASLGFYDILNRQINPQMFNDWTQVANTKTTMLAFEDTLRILMGEMDDTTSDTIKRAMDASFSAKTDKVSSRIAQRSVIDVDAVHTLPNGMELKLSQFVDFDVKKLIDRYAVTMSGDAGLARMGITSDGELKDIVVKVMEELAEEGKPVPTPENNKYLANLVDVLSQFKGRPTATNPEGTGQALAVGTSAFVRASTLGGTWLVATMEAARASFRAGSLNMYKAMPILKDTYKAYEGVGAEEGMSMAAREMRMFLSLGQEMYGMPSNYMYDALNIKSATQSGGFMNTLHGAQEATMQFGGAKSGQGMLEQIFATGVNQRIYTEITKTGTISDEVMTNVGWSRAMADSIAENIKKHANYDGDNVFNFHLWDDEAALNFSLGIRRWAASTVQRQMIGDQAGLTSVTKFGTGGLLKNSAFGRMAMTLQGYVMTAQRKQMLRVVDNFDANTAAEVMVLMGTAMMITKTKNHLNYSGLERDEKNRPENLAKDAINVMDMFGVFPQVLSASKSVLTGTNLQGYNTMPMTPPIISMGEDAVGAVKMLFKAPSDTHHVSAKDIESAMKVITPNFIGVNNGIRWASEILAQSPRDKEGRTGGDDE